MLFQALILYNGFRNRHVKSYVHYAEKHSSKALFANILRFFKEEPFNKIKNKSSFFFHFSFF